MVPAASGPCSCECCKKADCKCTGDAGRQCGCNCCTCRSCNCSAQQGQPAGGQQQPCKCPCCEKKLCTCKEATDCNCAGCQKHACACPDEAEKKKKEKCDCCCCKSNTPCCGNGRHQEGCKCRCCREETCACCKSKKAGASAAVAEPAAGKTSFHAVCDRSEPPYSSTSWRPTYHAASPSCTSSTHSGSSCCNSNHLHCRSCSTNHAHFWRSHVHCFGNTRGRHCSNAGACSTSSAPEGVIGISGGRECVLEQSTSSCPVRCALSDVSRTFVASCVVHCCCSNEQHDSSWHSPSMHLGDRVHRCVGRSSRFRRRCSSIEEEADQTVVRPNGGANVGEAKCEASEKGHSTLSPQAGTESSRCSAPQRDSEATHSFRSVCTPVTAIRRVICKSCRQCLHTENIPAAIAGEHELLRQQRFGEFEGEVEQQYRQCANKWGKQQHLSKDTKGEKSNSCVVDPEGRLLLECKTKEKVLLRRMRPNDYPAVRALLPRVSRCTLVLTEQQVHDVLSSPVFYAWCCFTVEPKLPLPQQRQEETLPHGENQQEGAEREVKHFLNQQQTKEEHHQQSEQPQQHGRQLQEDTIESRPDFYRENKLVAYCELVLQPRLGRKTDGRLERVVVEEAFCGRGVATRMCAAVLAAVKERNLCGYVDLTVEKDEARHIYEDILGFRKVDTTVLRLQL